MYIQKYYKIIRVIKDGDGGATPLYIENVSDSDGVFKLNKYSSPTYTPNLIYRIGDNGEWFEYDVATRPSITVPSGSKIYFRGDNINGFNEEYGDYYNFTFTNNYNIGGYITSLLALDNFNTITIIYRYSFCHLFKEQTNLLNAKDLITDNFTNVNGYIFSNCFDGCRSLTTAPNFDNVTTVGEYGFQYCFRNCTSLLTTPNFRNTTTIYTRAFLSCFNGCTSLQVVYAPSISTWNTSNFDSWLQNVSPTGVMYKPANLTIPTDSSSGVPTGWTTVDY